MDATLRLFKAVPIKKEAKKSLNDKEFEGIFKETVKRGFVLSPEVINEADNLDNLIKEIEDNFGLSPEKANSSFHKSWKKVKEAPMQQLVMEQIIHYFTTYGFENLGIYNAESVYIPNEELAIPEGVMDEVRLDVIRGLTYDEIKSLLLKFLGTGIALKKETIDDVLEVAMTVGMTEEEIDAVKNKEVKAALYVYLNKVPSNPNEFLRFVIYQLTGTTLIIKNKALIELIKEKKSTVVKGFFDRYEAAHGLEKLAQIFYRFKPIFLAFRTSPAMKKKINKLRKLAVKNHKPMPEDFLNSVTERIEKQKSLVPLATELEKASIWRKIRLAYALQYRITDKDSIVYKVRNGRGYATSFEFTRHRKANEVLGIVLDSISKELEPKFKGKKVFIPSWMEYSLPATEKMFTGNFPTGTHVKLDEDMIFGIHWENTGGHRIDLDLSLIDLNGNKFGWDSYYRSDDRNILFSGDVTDARKPKGASELFYVAKGKKSHGIMTVNFFNHIDKLDVPYKILVAKEKPENFGNNYTVNPENVFAVCSSQINTKQKTLGLVAVTSKGSKFFFSETSVGNSITARASEKTAISRKYLYDFHTDMISLREVLQNAGAEIMDELVQDDEIEIDYDLSPSTLDKTTIIDLLDTKGE